jgi:tetratricopeptide (TPR) repeat protein
MARTLTVLVVALAAEALAFVASAQPLQRAPPPVTAPMEAPAARPRYEAPAWVRERRPTATRRSKELLLQDIREDVGPLGLPTRFRTPADRAAFSLRQMENAGDVAAMTEGAAREIDEQPTSNRQQAETLARQRATLRAEAARYREIAVSIARSALDRAPDAPYADEILFRMVTSLAALGREDEARRALDTIPLRYPASPFAPHAHLATGDRAFARGEWAAAAVAYERASLPASTDNRVRAYALYRLAWARRLADEPAVALVHFDQALAWAAEHPDAPDVARLAEVAREERAALATRIAPSAPRPLRRRAAPAR